MDLIKGVVMGVIISLIVRQIIETRSAENTAWPTVGQENQSGVYT